MKRERVYIEKTSDGSAYYVLNDSKEALHSGTLPDCQSFVTDYEKGQDATYHKLLASIYYWASGFFFMGGLMGWVFNFDIGFQIALYPLSIILMITSEGHNAKC